MAQSWIQPQQNSLIDAFQQAEQIKAYRSTNALAQAKAAELPYERERQQALNTANVSKAEALTGKAQAETGRIDQDAAQKDLEFIARFPGDRQAVLGAFAKWAPKMPQLAPIAERLAGIQDQQEFAQEVRGFAVSSLDRMKEARAREEHADLQGYRGQQLDISRGQLGVSQANAADMARHRAVMENKPGSAFSVSYDAEGRPIVSYGPASEEKAAAAVRGKARAEAEIALPKVEDLATQSTRQVDELLTHPGFESAVGMTWRPYARRCPAPRKRIS